MALPNPAPSLQRKARRDGISEMGRHLALALVALAGLLGGSAAAETPTPGEPPAWAYRMPHGLMSPFCPGRTLAECPSPRADSLRLWILTQAAAGASQEEIEGMLLQRFGERILSAPRAEGWGLTAYVLPVVGFFLGGLVVVLALRRLVAPSPEPAPAQPVDPELEAAIDRELSRR